MERSLEGGRWDFFCLGPTIWMTTRPWASILEASQGEVHTETREAAPWHLRGSFRPKAHAGFLGPRRNLPLLQIRPNHKTAGTTMTSGIPPHIVKQVKRSMGPQEPSTRSVNRLVEQLRQMNRHLQRLTKRLGEETEQKAPEALLPRLTKGILQQARRSLEGARSPQTQTIKRLSREVRALNDTLQEMLDEDGGSPKDTS